MIGSRSLMLQVSFAKVRLVMVALLIVPSTLLIAQQPDVGLSGLPAVGQQDTPKQETEPATPASVQSTAIPVPQPLANSVPVQVFDLAQLQALAREKHPNILAARASLEAALARKQAVYSLRILTPLQPDLPIRRRQSCLGLRAAEAGVQLAQIDTLYAVQFCYVSYLYARHQMQLADRALEGLEKLRTELKKLIETDEKRFEEYRKLPEAKRRQQPLPPRDRSDLLRERDLNRVEALQAGARALRSEAEWGAERALSGLREAVGLPGDCPLVLAHDRLFDVSPPPLDRKHLLELALSRRPDFVQAQLLAEVHQLEVTAQHHARGLRVSTFAAATDLHVKPLPAFSSESDYKPGATGPEMPVSITGHRHERVQQATLYANRAAAVVERTRGLIQLQIEQAYLQAREMQEKLPNLERAVQLSRIAQQYTGVPFVAAQQESNLTQLITTGREATDAQIAALESRYRLLLALITLERHTAGGFCAGLVGAPMLPAPESVLADKKREDEIKKALKRFSENGGDGNGSEKKEAR